MRLRRAVAVVASLLSPGTGHLLLGLTRRGIGWAVAGLFPMLSVVWLLDSLGSTSLITAALLGTVVTGLLVHVGAAIDVARIRLADTRVPPWTRALIAAVVLGTLVWTVGVILDPGDILRERYVQAYVLPAGSMSPTLLVGDLFLVNKYIYRHQKPARGDVIVFKYPIDESRDFIKRVIGLPGEDVFINNRQVFINCRPSEPSCQPIKDPWGHYENRMGVGGEVFGPVRVPPRSYFVMGDNRDNSQDSRYWGFVKAEKIKGRVALIYWSWDRQGVGKPFWQRVRWNRLARSVQ